MVTKGITEIFRRLFYFNNGNVDTNLLYLATPSEAKLLKNLGIITPSSTETPRINNWYKLTDKAKQSFRNHFNFNVKITDEMNHELFNGGFSKVPAKYVIGINNVHGDFRKRIKNYSK